MQMTLGRTILRHGRAEGGWRKIVLQLVECIRESQSRCRVDCVRYWRHPRPQFKPAFNFSAHKEHPSQRTIQPQTGYHMRD